MIIVCDLGSIKHPEAEQVEMHISLENNEGVRTYYNTGLKTMSLLCFLKSRDVNIKSLGVEKDLEEFSKAVNPFSFHISTNQAFQIGKHVNVTLRECPYYGKNGKKCGLLITAKGNHGPEQKIFIHPVEDRRWEKGPYAFRCNYDNTAGTDSSLERWRSYLSALQYQRQKACKDGERFRPLF